MWKMLQCIHKLMVLKRRKRLFQFSGNKLAGTDVNVHPSVTGLYYLLDPIVYKNKHLKLVLLHNTFK